MNSFAVNLPLPPSVNNMFATSGKRRIVSKQYKAWRFAAGWTVLTAWRAQGQPAFDRHLSLTIHIGLGYVGDISNRIKGIEDILCDTIPGFPDDRYIERIEIERVSELEGANIYVQQLAPPEMRRCEPVAIGELVKPILAHAAAQAERF